MTRLGPLVRLDATAIEPGRMPEHQPGMAHKTFETVLKTDAVSALRGSVDAAVASSGIIHNRAQKQIGPLTEASIGLTPAQRIRPRPKDEPVIEQSEQRVLEPATLAAIAIGAGREFSGAFTRGRLQELPQQPARDEVRKPQCDHAMLPDDRDLPAPQVSARVVDQRTHFAPSTRGPDAIERPDRDSVRDSPRLLRHAGIAAADVSRPPKDGVDVAALRPTAVQAGPEHSAPTASAASQVLAALLRDRPQSDAEAIEAPAPTPAAPSSIERRAEAPLRILKIELQPASMGMVQVVLRSSERSLSVRIEVERPEALSSLDHDKKVLAERMGEAGYLVDELMIVPREKSNEADREAPRSGAFAGDGAAGSGSGQAQRQAYQAVAKRDDRIVTTVTVSEPKAELPENVPASVGSGRRLRHRI